MTTEQMVEAQYSEVYREALDSNFTLECEVCGAVNHGDGPKIVILCLPCYAQMQDWSVEHHAEDGGWVVIRPDGEPIYGDEGVALAYATEDEARASVAKHMAQGIQDATEEDADEN